MLSNRSRPFGDEGERAGVSIPPSGWSKTEGFQEHVILWRVNHSHVTGVLKIAAVKNWVPPLTARRRDLDLS